MGGSTLHGRSAELDEIVAALEQVRRGSATAFALVGEPGIGKTRLAEEVAKRAIDAGFTVCWGRAWEEGGAPAYWPWRNLFDAMPGVARDGALWGRRAAATDADAARFELFDAVATALRTASSSAPLVCVLDDLHAADMPSLELTAFVTRHLRSHPIVWLLTWRDVEAQGNAAIAAIARNTRTLALRRLSAGETRGLVEELASVSAADDTLFKATAGNPLFIVETLACLGTRGMSQLPTELEQLPVAEGVAAVVRTRARALSPAAQGALEAASLVGRDVSLDRWTTAADSAPESVASEIVASGLLVERDRTRWSFSHDVVREAISRTVAPDVARAVHARLAASLDQAPGERLHHGLAALPALDPALVVRWALEAAEESRAQCAYEETLSTLQRAMASLGAPRAADRRLSLALARAHLDLGDVTAARTVLQKTIDAARAFGDAGTLALAVLAYGSRYVLGDIHDDLVRMIDEALAALPSDERDLRARLLARKAAALTPGPDPASVLAMARDAFAIVSADEATRLDVCVGVGSAFGDFAHPRERIIVNAELVRLARSQRDRALELRGLSRLVTDHVEAGDFARADMVLRERDELARALKQPRFRWTEPLFRSMRAMPMGDFATCEASLAEADERGRESGDANAARCIAVHRHWFYLLRDDVDALVAHESCVLDALRSMPALVSAVVRASIRGRAGDAGAASEEVAAIATQLSSGAVNTIATAAEMVTDPALAHTLVQRLVSHADTYAVWGLFGLTCGLPISTTLGMLEADPDRATAYFEAALERTTLAGARALRAWTRYHFGRALVGRRPDEAAAQLDAAANEASALGMGRLPQRCAEVLGQPRTVRRVAIETPVLAFTISKAGMAWRIERTGRNVVMPALRGLPMIARLVATPDTEIHSLELVAGASGQDTGDAGEVLDERARATYRQRVAELTEQIEDAESRGDADRAEVARTELDALRQELSRAVGLGGRSRRTGAAAERARISAQRRIKEAIKKIRELDAELGDHLDRTIATGTFCIYEPTRRKRS